MTSAVRKLARQQKRVGIDLWNSPVLKAHINELLKPFRSAFSKIDFGIVVASFQKMVHDDANRIDVARLNPEIPTTPVRDIDEAKTRAGWYIDHWAMHRFPELNALKIEVDGEGKAHIGVEVDPEADKPTDALIGGKIVKVGKIAMTALKPPNPWEG